MDVQSNYTLETKEMIRGLQGAAFDQMSTELEAWCQLHGEELEGFYTGASTSTLLNRKDFVLFVSVHYRGQSVTADSQVGYIHLMRQLLRKLEDIRITKIEKAA